MKKMGYRVMVFITRWMIACDEASFLISYKSDNRIGLRKWWQLKMHLLTCHLCRKYARQIKQLNVAVDNYRIASGGESCRHHLSKEACSKIDQAVKSGLNAN